MNEIKSYGPVKKTVASIPTSKALPFNSYLRHSDKYTLDGWPSLAFPNSIDGSSTMKSSSDSEMKGNEMFWRIGPDKYVVSSCLYASSNDTQSDEALTRSQNISLKPPAVEMKTDERDEMNDIPSNYCQTKTTVVHDDSLHEHGNSSCSKSSGRTSPDNTYNTNDAATYNSPLSSTDLTDRFSSPSTTATLNTNSNHSNGSSFLSEGSSLFETTRALSMTDLSFESDTDLILDEYHETQRKNSSMSYSSNSSYSANNEDTSDLTSLLFSDRMEPLFADTVDEDGETLDTGDVQETISVSSSIRSEICNSEICVDAIVDLPWFFDDLNEDCEGECYKMNSDFLKMTAIILNKRSTEQRGMLIEPAIEVHSPTRMKKYLKRYTPASPITSPKEEIPSVSTVSKATQESNSSMWLVPVGAEEGSLHHSEREEEASTLIQDGACENEGAEWATRHSKLEKDKGEVHPTNDAPCQGGSSMLQNISNCGSETSSTIQSNVSSKDHTPRMANTTSSSLKPSKQTESISEKASLDNSEKTSIQENKASPDCQPKRNFPNGEQNNSEVLLGKLINLEPGPLQGTHNTKSLSEVEQDITVKAVKLESIKPTQKDAPMLTYHEGYNDTDVLVDANNFSIEMVIADQSLPEEKRPTPDPFVTATADPFATVTDIEEESSNIITSLKPSETLDEEDTYNTIEVGKTPHNVELNYKKLHVNKSTESAKDEGPQPPIRQEHKSNGSIVKTVLNLFPSFCGLKSRRSETGSLKEVTTQELTSLSDITEEKSVTDTFEDPNSAFQPSTYLAACIYDKDWDIVLAHLRASPLEARTWVKMRMPIKVNHDNVSEENDASNLNYHQLTVLPLHLACYLNAPHQVVQGLIDIYPEALRQKVVENKMLPIHIACEVPVDPTSLKCLINAWPLSLYSYDGDGNIPLTKVILSKPKTARKREIMDILLQETKKSSTLTQAGCAEENAAP